MVHHSGLEASTVQVVTGWFVPFWRVEQRLSLESRGIPTEFTTMMRWGSLTVAEVTVAEVECHLPPVVLGVDDLSASHGMTSLRF